MQTALGFDTCLSHFLIPPLISSSLFPLFLTYEMASASIEYNELEAITA